MMAPWRQTHTSEQQRRSVLVETALTSGTRGAGGLTNGQTLIFQSIFVSLGGHCQHTQERLREWTCLCSGSGPLGFLMVTGIVVAGTNKEKVHRAAHKCTASPAAPIAPLAQGRLWCTGAYSTLAVSTPFPTPARPLCHVIRCCFISWK